MQRQQFTTKFSALLTMSGAAIGLGNIWRFPYMMGSYGGSAFLLVYLLFMILLAIPALSAEWALGRRAQGGTVSAFILAYGEKRGRALGYLLVAGMVMASSYYLVIIGNVGYMTAYTMLIGFGGDNNARFLEGLGNEPFQYVISVLVLGAILGVAYRGLNDGIEKVSKLFVPFFFLVILYLIFITFQLEGATEKMAEFLRPDFSQLDAKSVFAALGQAAFSVGLGGLIMLVYGSYLSPDTPLLKGAFATALTDTGAALLAALFIFPTILVFGISPEAGPTLLFETLPHLFLQMEGGRAIGALFMTSLFLIAFLSGLAGLEVVITSISDDAEFNGFTRNRTIVTFGSIQTLVMLLPALVPDAIGTMDLIFGSGMQSLGSALALIGLTWCLGKSAVVAEFGSGTVTDWLYLWLRWVVPFAILAIIGLTFI